MPARKVTTPCQAGEILNNGLQCNSSESIYWTNKGNCCSEHITEVLELDSVMNHGFLDWTES